MTRVSHENSDNEVNADPEAPRSALFEDIDAIEEILEPFKGTEPDSLRAELQDKTKRLEALSESELSSYKFSILKREVNKLKKKAETLASTPLMVMKSRLSGNLGTIENTLTSIKNKKLAAAGPEREKIIQAVDVLLKELTDQQESVDALTEKQFSDLQTKIDQLETKVDTLATRSFLTNEIGLLGKILESARVGLFRRGKLSQLVEEVKQQQQRLTTLTDDELVSFRHTIGEIKERSETLIIHPSLTSMIQSGAAIFLLAIIPVALVLYMLVTIRWQTIHQNEIQTIAAMTGSAIPTLTLTNSLEATPTSVTPSP